VRRSDLAILKQELTFAPHSQVTAIHDSFHAHERFVVAVRVHQGTARQSRHLEAVGSRCKKFAQQKCLVMEALGIFSPEYGHRPCRHQDTQAPEASGPEDYAPAVL
jgi:hypothetical protein